MSNNVLIKTKCPQCGAELEVEASVNKVDEPKLRCNLKPVSNTLEYRVSSKDIAKFVSEKAKQYVPEVRCEVVPRYCQSKRKNPYEPLRSYASLRIAFSDNVVSKNNELGWYGKIGESADSVSVIPSMFTNIIERYSYNIKDINEWLDSYKNLEALEERHGMTEAFIEDLKNYAKPRRIVANNNEGWIIFSAAPENIIRDMFTDPSTGHVPGKIEILNPIEIQKGGEIEYKVLLHSGSDVVYSDNPHVRQIMLGEEKPKNK